MSAPVDFVMESPDRNAVLLVEAKNVTSPSSEWAARFARNLLEHVKMGANHYLLLFLRNRLYLWKHAPKPGDDLPDFEARTEDVLRPYLTHMRYSLNEIDGISFEFLVKSWLMDLSDGAVHESVGEWVRDSGLDEFQNAVVREEVPN
jgi:hypothetical protein